jgi:arylsulfatase
MACAEAAPPSDAAPLVVLVSIDTLRADRLGVLGNTRGLTPNLDAFAREAVVFTSAWSQSNTTAMSHASMFTSRYTSELGEPGPRFSLGTDGTTLAEVLALYGWDTAGFTGGLHLDPGWGLSRGFATFEATPPLGSFWTTMPAAADWLDSRKDRAPTFLFVHGYDVHAPYLTPAPFGTAWTDRAYEGPAATAVRRRVGTELVFDGRLFRDDDMLGLLWDIDRPRPRDPAGRAAVAAAGADPEHPSVAFGEADAAYVRDVYDGAVAYADAMFGWFLHRLRASGRYDDALILVMSDHGEALGEAGRFGHGDATSDEELHVPLLVRPPGGAHRVVDAPVALLDVLPTVLEHAGATVPADARGHTLMPWVRGETGAAHRPVFAEGSLREVSARDAAGRLTFSGIGGASPFLPALLADARDDDPAWSVDTTVEEPAARGELRAALGAWREAVAVSTAGPGAVDEEAVRQAREHGYFTP